MATPETARDAFDAWRAHVAANRFDTDPHLASLLAHHGRGDTEDLRAFGALCGGVLDDLARETNRDENLPAVRRYDRFGNRTEEIVFHPAYHQMGRLLYRTGLITLYAEAGRELDTIARLYLYATNGEAGHACPVACTAGLVKILNACGGDRDGWMERLLDPNYDTHFHGAQFLTEIQGGSDVGANTLVAREEADGWRLYGEKWFCSVADAQLWLVTARPEDAPDGTRGVRAFVVPRTLPGGRTNDFQVRRLKYKLGTRSMASAELDFHGAVAHPVGDFRKTVEIVLNTSRMFNAVCSAGMLQRAWLEADGYARARTAFGRPILSFPTVARTVAGLRTDAYATRGLTFALAALSDRMATGDATEAEGAAWRMLVNLNKYWTSQQGTSGARDAIEILGGNGTIEEFTVMPRMLRDSIVCEAWEGAHNVLCTQAYKDAKRYALHEPMFALLERMGGPDPRLDAARERFERLLAMPEQEALVHVRDVADHLRPIAQAQALRAEQRGGGTDPLLPTVIEHLLATTTRGYDPLEDGGLMERVRALTG